MTALFEAKPGLGLLLRTAFRDSPARVQGLRGGASNRRSAAKRQKKARKSGRKTADRRLVLGLIGLDLAGMRTPIRPAAVVAPVMLTVLVAALGLAALRIDLLRIRYALGVASDREQVLLDEKHSLIAEMRSLRDPVRLARRADELGFVRPERLIDLPERASPRLAHGASIARARVAPSPTAIPGPR